MSTEAVSVTLSSKGLSRVLDSFSDDAFTFVLGNQHYTCHRSLAEFISPFVSNMRRLDKTCNSFVVDETDDSGKFEQILELMRGNSVTVDAVAARYLLFYAEKLGNTELYGLLRDVAECPITRENAAAFLLQKISADLNYDDEVLFIASHFSEFSVEEFRTIPLRVLEMIFSSPSLRVDTEGDLYDRVRTLIAYCGPAYRVLYNYVLYEYLNEGDMAEFLADVRVSDLSEELWEAISKRLLMKAPSRSQSIERFSESAIVFDKDPFDGIVSYLRKTTGSNPSLNGLIDISYLGGNSYCDKLFEQNWKCYWSSTNAPGQWLNFEFKKHRVYLTDYTLKTPNSSPGWNHMKSWVVEGSDDGINWCELDRREDNNDLNGNSRVMTWTCQNPQRVRNVRIRQIGKNHHNADDIQLTNIEFFGHLTEL